MRECAFYVSIIPNKFNFIYRFKYICSIIARKNLQLRFTKCITNPSNRRCRLALIKLDVTLMVDFETMQKPKKIASLRSLHYAHFYLITPSLAASRFFLSISRVLPPPPSCLSSSFHESRTCSPSFRIFHARVTPILRSSLPLEKGSIAI